MATTALTQVDTAVAQPGLVTVLSGAVISTASGIPPFRGPECNWTAGARKYAPM